MFSPVSSIVLDYTQVLQIHYTITVAYLVFSTIIGIITFIFANFKNKVGLYVFSLGYLIAFISMFYSFSQNLDGWQDLIGLLQMMMILGIGLIVSVIIQVVMHYRNKF
jgi:hypothetical protein